MFKRKIIVWDWCWYRIGLVLVVCAGLLQPVRAQFVPGLVWATLEQVNEWEGTSLFPYDLNTAESQIRVLGAFYSTYPQSWFVAVDSARGVFYLPERPNDRQIGGSGGSIAVLDLKTLTVQRRLIIEHEGVQITPDDVSMDTVENRLFVGDHAARRLYIVDAESGIVQASYTRPYRFIPSPYSRTTNRLYLWRYDPQFAVEALDLADLQAEPVPLQPPPVNPAGEPSYFIVNDEAKLAYWGFALEAQVFAYDIDPASATFHQIIWSTGGSVAGGEHQRQWLQPSVDRVRGRLYVPDVLRGVIRVFDARRGPSLHQELTSIPIAEHLPNLQPALDPDQEPPGAMVAVEVDPVTGLLYAVFRTSSPGVWDGWGWEAGTPDAFVVTIHPAQGVVGRTALPVSVAQSTPAPFMTLDPGTRRMLVSTGVSGGVIAVLEDRRAASLETSASSSPVSIAAPEASLTFAAVTAGGTTTITPQLVDELPQSLPGVFSIGGALLYEIATTAIFSGPITLCFTAGHVDDPSSFDALRVLHLEGETWVDRTVSRDFASRTICASSDSLSPFVVARLDGPAYMPRLLYSTDRAYRSGSTAPLKVQVLDWSATNVSAVTLSLKILSVRQLSDEAPVAVEDAGRSNPDSTFRYDADLQGYVLNLSTKGLSPGSYSMTVEVGDTGQLLQLPFGIR